MSNEAFLVIAGMAVIIYATRAGGYWLVGRFTPSPRVAGALDQLASATLVALTAPAVFGLGVAGLAAAAAVGIVALRTGSLVLAMVVGMGVVAAMR
jgi:uncharacterized membrane protein